MRADLQEKLGPDFDEGALLREAQEFHKERLEEEADNFKAMADDLKMFHDQWDATARAEREALSLPVYQNNRLSAYIGQITGEVRRNKPGVHCILGDGEAQADTAEVFEGIIRSVERASDAPSVYAAVVKSAAACGIGHARLYHVFPNPKSFDAELRIGFIEDPFSVLWGEAKRLDKGDAKKCLVATTMNKKTFERTYPDDGPATWAQEKPFIEGSTWACGQDNKVTMAEYWMVKEEPMRLMRVAHDQTWVDQFGRIQPPTFQEATLEDPTEEEIAELKRTGFSILQERQSTKSKVCMYLLGGNAVLDYAEWPGERIPIFTCYGEQTHCGDRVVTQGIVRNAKDAIKAVNLARSIDLQLLGAMPKSPFMLDPKVIKGHEDLWNASARIAFPYLPYNSGEGDRPERAQPISQNPGPQSLAAVCGDDMQSAFGIFNSSIGRTGNEKSGVAIRERDQQADTTTYVYIDNLSKMIAAIGQEAVNVIPIIYSTQKMVAIVGPDDADAVVNIEQMAAEGRGLDIGKYQVICKTGPAYQTRREKAADRLVAIGQFAEPWAKPIIMKYLVQYDEMPNAEEFARELEEAGRAMGALPPAPGAAPPMAGPPGAPVPPEMQGGPDGLPPPQPGLPQSAPVVAPLEAGPPGRGALN